MGREDSLLSLPSTAARKTTWHTNTSFVQEPDTKSGKIEVQLFKKELSFSFSAKKITPIFLIHALIMRTHQHSAICI